MPWSGEPVLCTNSSWIQIDFHDTGSGPRVPSMTDHFGFTMAALNENGSVFANPCKGEKSMSTLMYRPFSTWANNSEVQSFTFISVHTLCGNLDVHILAPANV